MFSRNRRYLPLSGLIIAFALMLLGTPKPTVSAFLTDTSGKEYHTHLPLIFSTPDPLTGAETVMQFLNYMRYHAGVPAAIDDSRLNHNCFEHARYMAENNLLTHQEDPQMPFYSANGQICAKKANTWLGSESPNQPWRPMDALHSWRTSVAHRLWMIYPTTTVFGFGFYNSEEFRSGAAIDVLSNVNFDNDDKYSGWPIQYPGPGQRNIPAMPYPITINWRYFGPKPQLHAVRLTTEDGKAIPYDANTDLDAGHKGIQILPKVDLPERTVIKVTISGSYDGRPFNYSWDFMTGARNNMLTSFMLEDSIWQLVDFAQPEE